MNIIFKLFWLTSVVYFLQGIEDLSTTPLFFYFKETLHLSESQIMYITSLFMLPWLIKPVWGYLIDSFTWLKKQWILFSCIGSLIVCLTLGTLNALPLFLLIILMMVANATTSIRDVASDGLMCVEGKKYEITGKIQSINWIAITIASILTGVAGGYLAEHYSYQTSFILLIPFYLVLLWVARQYPEVHDFEVRISKKARWTANFIPPTEPYNQTEQCIPKSNVHSKMNIWGTLKDLFTDKNLLWVALFIFLYKFSPSFGTPLTFIERDEFGWSKMFIGTMGTIASVANLIGAGLYFKFSKFLDMRKGLIISTIVGAITTAAFLYFTPITAVIYNVITSVIGMFIMLMLLDLMARKTKSGREAISFALLCSVSNLATTCNNLIGGFLFPLIGLNWLIIISALTSFLCLPIIKKIRI